MLIKAQEKAREISRLPRMPRALLALGVFALIGPPVGGLVAWHAMGARSLRSPLPFVAGSYGEGLILALGAVALVAIAALLLGRNSWPVPIAAAILINVVIHAAMAAADSAPPDSAVIARVAGVFLPPSIVAAIVCWLLTRPLLKP